MRLPQRHQTRRNYVCAFLLITFLSAIIPTTLIEGWTPEEDDVSLGFHIVRVWLPVILIPPALALVLYPKENHCRALMRTRGLQILIFSMVGLTLTFFIPDHAPVFLDDETGLFFKVTFVVFGFLLTSFMALVGGLGIPVILTFLVSDLFSDDEHRSNEMAPKSEH